MRTPDVTDLDIPDFALVVLIGATGSGKSSFAGKHFTATEVISSDRCRGMVSDDETDQSVSADAFDLVRAIAEKRLKHRKLAVIDATNVRAADRKAWIDLARRWHALPVAIVLDPGADICIERNKGRPDRAFGGEVARRMTHEIRKGMGNLQREGFRQVWRLTSADSIEVATLKRSAMWTDKRHDLGPFDIFGDVHGCSSELESLLIRLGWHVNWHMADGERRVTITPPEGRKAVFVGDLVDRGPRTPDVLRMIMAITEAGHGYAVMGNHDRKLARWLDGKDVRVAHGLAESIAQLSSEPPAFRETVRNYLDGLRSHVWLDGGKLAVAHAGLKEEMIGRGSAAVRDFALYGETTGETDEFGLPVRMDWAAEYRGSTAVVYGHTPIVQAAWVNSTICIDTGCVFGGSLTALRWPERELVSVPAEQVYTEPVRPTAPLETERSPQAAADDVLDMGDVTGRRWIDTELRGRIVIAEENAAAALEVMSRFAIAPQWLIYLPPTMSPSETSEMEGWLERPEEAFSYYRKQNITEVVCEEKHMGSRAVIAMCRSSSVARTRFGTSGDDSGAIWTRTGRAFFGDRDMTEGVLARMRHTFDACCLWDELGTDWVLLDAEIMPWSAKASSLIDSQFAPVAASSRAGLSAALDAMALAEQRGVLDGNLRSRFEARRSSADAYGRAWAPFVWPVTGLSDLRVAPFHLLASEGRVYFDHDHVFHMTFAERLAAAGGAVTPTRWRLVDLSDAEACEQATGWWENMTALGGEGMVVKPRPFFVRGAKGVVQPALKVRGREYLRIIYGPEYDLPEHMIRLRERGVGGKRNLALREFALGHEALRRFVAREPLRRIHECVFGILALESEPIDPRL
jgi:protein phosphatase